MICVCENSFFGEPTLCRPAELLLITSHHKGNVQLSDEAVEKFLASLSNLVLSNCTVSGG